MSLDEEWNNFINNNDNNEFNENNKNNENNEYEAENNEYEAENNEDKNEDDEAKNDKNEISASNLYISTKTKIIYLNIGDIDIYDVFWKINIINYNDQLEGIIKKQMKVSLTSKEESEIIDNKIENINNFTKIKIINKLENISNRSKYKDIRKISIGISKKDLFISRCKEKSAFYNCFVLSLRLLEDNIFKEYHIKVFNTGKIEIPGLQKNDSLYKIINYIINELSLLLNKEILYDNEKIENVLVNSNFDCGFYINREKLFYILRNKYHINAAYDPCSYPGIQCCYYYNNITNEVVNNFNTNNIKKMENIVKVSYMIFRTGSVLIVGKCNDDILNNVYEYIKYILKNEFKQIVTVSDNIIKNKKLNTKNLKNKKKLIYIN